MLSCYLCTYIKELLQQNRKMGFYKYNGYKLAVKAHQLVLDIWYRYDVVPPKRDVCWLINPIKYIGIQIINHCKVAVLFTDFAI